MKNSNYILREVFETNFDLRGGVIFSFERGSQEGF